MEINLPISAPVNNNIQGNVYDKIDAITFERIRVANSLLETKLSMQEKVINRHRRDAERVHVNQTERLKREYRKIRAKKPDYVFDDSELSTRKSKDRSHDTGRQRSLSESSNCSFCRRFYSHHYHLKDETRARRKEQEQKKNCKKDDYFNMTLRIFFLNMMNHSRTQALETHDQIDHDHETHDRIHHSDEHRMHPTSRDTGKTKKDKHGSDKDEGVPTDHVWNAEDEDIDELRDLRELPDEIDSLSCSLNASKISLDSCGTGNLGQLSKAKLSQSLNFPSCTSVPEESRMDIKEDKELWKRSKRAFDKIFAGLL